MHVLGQVLSDAIDGRFPTPDAQWSRIPPWRAGLEGVVAMTAHTFVAVADDVTDAELEALGVDGLCGALAPTVTLALAGEGYVECHDMVLGLRVPDLPVSSLVERRDLADSPRARLATTLREDVRVLGNTQGDDLVTVGRGVGGLTEIGIEVSDPGRGRGAELVRGALATLPVGTPVLACCAPGNVRAVRTFTACGFALLGSVQLVLPDRASRRRTGALPAHTKRT